MRDTTVQIIKYGSVSSTNDSSSDCEDYSSDELASSVNDDAVSELTDKLSSTELIPRKPTRVTSDRREQNRANSTPWYACINQQVQSGGSVTENVPAVGKVNTLFVTRPNASRTQIPNLSPTSFSNNNFLTSWSDKKFCDLPSEVNTDTPILSSTNLNIPTQIENVQPNLTPPEDDFLTHFNFYQNINFADDYLNQDTFTENESSDLNLNSNLNTCEDSDVIKNIIITSYLEPLPQLTHSDVTDNLPNFDFNSTADDLLNLSEIGYPPTPVSVNFSDPDNFPQSSVDYSESSSYCGSSDYSPCPKFDTPSRRASSEESFCPNNFDDNIPTTVREVNTPLGQNSKRDSAKNILKQLVNQKPDFKKNKWIIINATAKVSTLKVRIREIIQTKDLNNIDWIIILYVAIEAFLKIASENEIKQLFEETPSILEILTFKKHKVLVMYIIEILWNYNLKINTSDKSGKNILHRLVEEKTDYNEMISALLSFWDDDNRRIFNVNEQDADGLTPVHYAIRSHADKLETLKILLRNGANFLRTIPSNNQNYLHYAVENAQNMNLVKVLLEEIEKESTVSLVQQLKVAKDIREFTAMDILIRKQMSTSETNKMIPLVMPPV